MEYLSRQNHKQLTSICESLSKKTGNMGEKSYCSIFKLIRIMYSFAKRSYLCYDPGLFVCTGSVWSWSFLFCCKFVPLSTPGSFQLASKSCLIHFTCPYKLANKEHQIIESLMCVKVQRSFLMSMFLPPGFACFALPKLDIPLGSWSPNCWLVPNPWIGQPESASLRSKFFSVHLQLIQSWPLHPVTTFCLHVEILGLENCFCEFWLWICWIKPKQPTKVFSFTICQSFSDVTLLSLTG